MRKEYDLQTDVLATIVATTPVTPKHADLLTAFATRTEFRGARHVKSRDEFGARPARVIDANGREIAPTTARGSTRSSTRMTARHVRCGTRTGSRLPAGRDRVRAALLCPRSRRRP